jgi:hypothetical protein
MNLVEVDLLRGGTRVVGAPDGGYLASITRQPDRTSPDFIHWQLESEIPNIPIPLRRGEQDATMYLQDTYEEVYNRSGFDYVLNYRTETVPPLDAEQKIWMETLRHSRRLPKFLS